MREEIRFVICRLFFREHCTIEQIAERLGCQVQTVRRVLVIDGGVKTPAPTHGPYHKEDAS
jgi:hypothetical protein